MKTMNRKSGALRARAKTILIEIRIRIAG